MQKGKIIFGALLLLCLGLFAAPVLAAEKSIIIGVASDALYMDPQQQNETITNAVTRHFYESLMVESADGDKLIPMLAESWELQPDQVTWVFKLRKGVKFSDGSPFTAEDVKFSIDRVRKYLPKYLVATVKDVEVVDPHTVKFITKAPDGVMPDNLAKVCMMSKAYTTKVGDEAVNLKPMGTGPYVLVEWVKEDHITLAPNKHYWGKAPAVSNVRFRPITNAATRTAALLTGEIDIAEDIPVRDVPRVEKTKGIDVVKKAGRRLMYMHIDGTREPTPAIEGGKNPMKDLRVRQAISMGIDRNTIVKVTMNGNGYPTGQLILEGKRGYLPGLPVPAYNPEKARQLMKQAGYEKGFTVRMDAPNGRYPNDAQVAQAIASQLAKIGVKIDLMLHPKSTFFDYIRPGDKSSLVMTGWAEEVDTGALGNVLFYSRGKNPAKGPSNRCFYSNAAYDKLLDEADSTADIAKRAKLLEESSRVILNDVGCIPLFFNQDIYGKKSKVTFKPRANKQILAFEIDVKN